MNELYLVHSQEFDDQALAETLIEPRVKQKGESKRGNQLVQCMHFQRAGDKTHCTVSDIHD